ncbi:MAG: FHA domain-containing protein [Acidobacteria bacterium]|nr:MAG: FHA domain-containing protein [Acidobacteriota bacterium]
MIIQCSSCRTRYHYDEARFAGAPAKRIRCTKCGTVFEIRNPAAAGAPSPGFQPDETGPLNSPVLGSDDFSLDATMMGGGPRKRPLAVPPPPAAPQAPRPVPVPPPLPQSAAPAGSPSTAEYPRPQAAGSAGAVDAEARDAGPRRLRLPEWERLSLACLGGPDAGKIFEIDKPRVVIGRAGADVLLSDGECSRQHAAVEVLDDKVYLVDLGSTNGTYLGERRVTRAEIENRTEFDVGASTLMLIRARKD